LYDAQRVDRGHPVEHRQERQLETPGGEAGDKTKPDRVVGGKQDDWDGRGCRLGREHRRVTSGLLANQFGRQRRQSIDLIFGPTVLDRHVLALDNAHDQTIIGGAREGSKGALKGAL
jgi:hypothetical protein